MKILITGGTGFIGRPLCKELTLDGHELVLATRDPRRHQLTWGLPSEFLKWDMEHEDCPISLESFDAVIHLAGESIAGGLWTAKQKHKILHSRVDSTVALGRALALRKTPLPCFIAAAATGIYPSSLTEAFSETNAPGHDFLADVCVQWEAAVKALPQVKREVRLRFGIVLGQGGGFLEKLILPTRMGLGATIGGGGQWLSWVHRDDIIGLIKTSLSDQRYVGVINAVAPEPVTQKIFQKVLAKLLNRPAFLRVPGFLIKSAFGEFSQLVLGSQKVEPTRLVELGYQFRFSALEPALANCLDLHDKQGKAYLCHRMEAVQFVPRPLEEVFAFFCNPNNLEKITPPLLSFKVKDISTKDIDEGTIINYRLKVRGIPMNWRTLIMNWRKNEVFVDNQEQGPYAIWHHTHGFYPVRGGTLMTDLVRYRLPMGILGDGLALPMVKRDIKTIFAYRRKIIEAEFGQPIH